MSPAASSPPATTDLIVSANDAKYQRVEGRDTYPEAAGPDTLTVLDASGFPPSVVATVEVEHSIAGPPQAVAITPDGRLAIVAAPDRYDRAAGRTVPGTFLQLVDLAAAPPRVVGRVELGCHPQGLAIAPDGRLLLAATLGGSLAVLVIDGGRVTLKTMLALSTGRLSGVAFTPDGTAALVGLRDEQGIVVLDVRGSEVTTERERVATGVAPYAIDVSRDGGWAVVGNVGLAGLSNPGRLYGDVDTVTLIDVRRRPFRAVQHLTVPALPEGVALSPDGRWIAVQAMAGSNLAVDNPGRRAKGRVLLFAIRDGAAVPAGDLPGGEAGQGIVFTADSRFVIAQFNVEHELAVFAVDDGALRDTGVRITVPGGPASIRAKPR